MTLWADLGKSVEALRTWSDDDATAFVEFDRRVRSLSKFLADIGDETPPEIKGPGMGDALMGLRLTRAFRGLGRDDGRTILRVLAMAVADFVAESFTTDAIRATAAWRGVRYTAMGPWSAGSTSVLLADAAGNDGGGAGETVFAKGGPSAVSDALASAATVAGAEIRTGAACRVDLDRATAPSPAWCSRRARRSRHRPSCRGLDPKRLLTTLVDPVTVGPNMRWRAGNIRTPGTIAKVNLVLDGLPEFPAAGGDARLLRGRIQVGTTSIDAMEHAFDASKYGRFADEPVLEATIPSLVDPSLVAGAKDGTHVMSVIAQWMPPMLVRRRLGGAARGRGRRSSCGRWRPWRPGSRRGSRRARSSRRPTSRPSTGSPAAIRCTRSPRSTRSACGARCWAGRATGCRSRVCTSRAPARIRAAA